MKARLVAALNEIVGLLLEATAAIQRDDYETASEKLEAAHTSIREQSDELRAA